MMNAILISFGLPQNLWGGSFFSTNQILNKISHKKNDLTPYELWKGRKLSYKYLKVWGCLTKLAILNPKIVKCVFIGYANNSSAYRFLVYKSNIPNIHENAIIESRNASFF